MKKYIGILILILIFLGGIVLYQHSKFNDNKLHIVFCDVGQGDGIFIRTPLGKNILIDSGPDDKIIDCIQKHSPFWERTISFAILTHPHADHFTGFKSIFNTYKVDNFAGEKIENDTTGYRYLKDILNKNNLDIKYLYSGDLIKVRDGLKILVLGPDKEFLNQVSPSHLINQASEQATLVMLLSFKNFDVVFAGDSQSRQILDDIQDHNIKNVEILKVPHHGSKTGLNPEILSLLRPKYGVISVGAPNRYGHPTKFILDLLSEFNVKTLRTDKNGDIEIITDGENIQIR